MWERRPVGLWARALPQDAAPAAQLLFNHKRVTPENVATTSGHFVALLAAKPVATKEKPGRRGRVRIRVRI